MRLRWSFARLSVDRRVGAAGGGRGYEAAGNAPNWSIPSC